MRVAPARGGHDTQNGAGNGAVLLCLAQLTEKADQSDNDGRDVHGEVEYTDAAEYAPMTIQKTPLPVIPRETG